MSFSKKIINRFFVILNVLLVCIYLLACLVPFINPSKYWLISIIGLAFPLLFCLLVIFIAGAAIARSKWILFSLLALLVSFQQIKAVFALHPFQTFAEKKTADNLRVLSWNVSSWDELNKAKKGGTSYREQMMNEVRRYDADVLCFQEFLETRNLELFDPTIREIEKMGYPYHYYLPSYSEMQFTEMGMIIFSKYPIVNTGMYDFGDKVSVQQMIYADIKVDNNIVRLFSVHLQSVRFGEKEYQSLDQLKKTDKTGLKESKTIVSKLKRGYTFRGGQADIVRDFVEKSPYPLILCGDFNDVPNSYTYFTIKGNLQDAFLQKGSGLGRTFRHISPTLRIDYIFADKKFTIKQFHRITVPYSDHFGILTDLTL